MGTYETRSRTRQISSGNISEEKMYTSSRNRLLCRANELSEQHGCQVAVIVIKEDQVTQYSSCEMVDVLKRYSDMCTQPHLSLNQSDFEKCEESKQKENKSWQDNIMSDTTPSEKDLHQIGPMTFYSQPPQFEVDEPPAKQDSYQDVLRNFEWYAQEMHEEAEMLLSDNKGMRGDHLPPHLPIDLPGNQYSDFGEFDQQEILFDSMDTEYYGSTDFYSSAAPIPQQFIDGLNFDKNTSRPESSPSNTTNDDQFSLGGVQVQ